MMPWEMMAVKEMLICCFVGTLLVSGVGSWCVPTQCLDCEKTTKVPALNESSEVCYICTNKTCLSVPEIPLNCKKDFKAHLNSSSGYSLKAGDDLILHCHHNLPLVDWIEWQRDRELLIFLNVCTVSLVASKGAYRCRVHSPCGNVTSREWQVDVDDGGVLLVVLCGSCAVVLVLGMGGSMKYKQKKEQDAQKRRQEERAKELQMTSNMTPRNN